MQFGYFIGLDRTKNRLVTSNKEMMLEDFMSEHEIQNPQDVVGPYDLEQTTKLKPYLTKALLRHIHGSDDPRIVSAARSTSLFEPRGPIVGDIGGELPMSLMEFLYKIQGGR